MNNLGFISLEQSAHPAERFYQIGGTSYSIKKLSMIFLYHGQF